ncbi:Precorrin-6A reductase [Anoxybacillus ayderensis]|uniref:Precorrin-6A reductase n=1 Tax=Anoxybacillus ayderensis TaxID=265546 RepID=A0A0D0HR43_9BACL|nr:precorrin-6A reductase [Anoxybacillus ayderensis]KHF30442.1 Precorrin-6A reductase [Anoxybacillus sp. BCO1]KIP21762.1 Precorrin-6A reductase [Anoxybacillus ayderensis]
MIMMLSGTSDARQLALAIRDAGYDVFATVVTEHAAEQMAHVGLHAHVGRLTACEMVQLIQQHRVTAIVDASHPFAEEASRQAMKAAEEANVPYIRYERKESVITYDRVTFVDSYEAAAQYAANKKGVVMLTTGSKTLPIFADMLLPLPDVRLIARMLPRKDNMELCERLRFPQENIIAMQGPFTKQLDIALMQHFGVTLLVTKESGRVGFVDEKIAAAQELGIETVVIRRPKLSYPVVYHEFSDVIRALGEIKMKGEK